MKFSYYDSCLLMSICMADDHGTDIKGIISYIDYIDHSIISWPEISGALIKLKTIGAVKEKGKILLLTAKFKTWWLKKYKTSGNRSVSKQVEALNAYLDECYAEVKKHHPDIHIGLTEEDYLMALKAYAH